MKNAHQILGVDRNASQDEIKKAYKKLAKLYHPDINPSESDKFENIKNAYDFLSSPQSQYYDRASYAPDIDLEKIFSRHKFNYNEIIKMVKVNLHLTFEEIHSGCERIIQLDDHQNTKTKLKIPAGTIDYCNFNVVSENIKYKIGATIVPILENGFYLSNGILHKKIEITAREFIESDTIEIENHLGSKFSLKINKNTNTGSYIRLPQKGLYDKEKKSNTDLLIQLVVRRGE
jgi:DnaJ-class molecular chaperone